MKFPKLELVCSPDELRPLMNHVLVTKENIVATDAHILIVHRTASLFDKEFIRDMPDQFLIHKLNWKDIATGDVHKCSYIPIRHLILTKFNTGKELYSPVHPSNELDGRIYPDWEKVIPNKPVKLNSIGINLALIERLRKALILDYERSECSLTFHGTEKAIIIQAHQSDSFAVLMPVMMPRDERSK